MSIEVYLFRTLHTRSNLRARLVLSKVAQISLLDQQVEAPERDILGTQWVEYIPVFKTNWRHESESYFSSKRTSLYQLRTFDPLGTHRIEILSQQLNTSEAKTFTMKCCASLDRPLLDRSWKADPSDSRLEKVLGIKWLRDAYLSVTTPKGEVCWYRSRTEWRLTTSLNPRDIMLSEIHHSFLADSPLKSRENLCKCIEEITQRFHNDEEFECAFFQTEYNALDKNSFLKDAGDWTKGLWSFIKRKADFLCAFVELLVEPLLKLLHQEHSPKLEKILKDSQQIGNLFDSFLMQPICQPSLMKKVIQIGMLDWCPMELDFWSNIFSQSETPFFELLSENWLSQAEYDCFKSKMALQTRFSQEVEKPFVFLSQIVFRLHESHERLIRQDPALCEQRTLWNTDDKLFTLFEEDMESGNYLRNLKFVFRDKLIIFLKNKLRIIPLQNQTVLQPERCEKYLFDGDDGLNQVVLKNGELLINIWDEETIILELLNLLPVFSQQVGTRQPVSIYFGEAADRWKRWVVLGWEILGQEILGLVHSNRGLELISFQKIHSSNMKVVELLPLHPPEERFLFSYRKIHYNLSEFTGLFYWQQQNTLFTACLHFHDSQNTVTGLVLTAYSYRQLNEPQFVSSRHFLKKAYPNSGNRFRMRWKHHKGLIYVSWVEFGLGYGIYAFHRRKFVSVVNKNHTFFQQLSGYCSPVCNQSKLLQTDMLFAVYRKSSDSRNMSVRDIYKLKLKII